MKTTDLRAADHDTLAPSANGVVKWRMGARDVLPERPVEPFTENQQVAFAAIRERMAKRTRRQRQD